MIRLMQRQSSRRILILLAVALVVLGWTVRQQLLAGYAGGASPAQMPQITAAEAAIERLQARLRDQSQEVAGSAAGGSAAGDSDTAAEYAQLGLAYLQRVRETDDPAFYSRAEAAFVEALAREPGQNDALVGQGQLALARHDFAAALDWGEQARRANPYRAAALGILVDAHVELGQYEEAVAAAQQMVSLRPDLASYSRVAYLRELHGDVAGAIEAMRAAVEMGLPGREETLWAQYQLGRLYFNSGDWNAAEGIYADALRLRPDYAYAQAGLAEVRAARGEYGPALAIMQPLVERRPLPAFAMLLGDLYHVAGLEEEAQRTYQLVEALQQLNIAAGMDVDLEMALFLADRGGDPAEVLQLARAAYDRRPTIYAADALAWALYHAGDYQEAARYSAEALRLGTRDAMLFYHAGVIAAQNPGNFEFPGFSEGNAADYLRTALAINPGFSLLHAPVAESMLASP